MRKGFMSAGAFLKLILVAAFISLGIMVANYGIYPTMDKVQDFFSLEARGSSGGSPHSTAREDLQRATAEFGAFYEDIKNVADASQDNCFALISSPSKEFFNSYNLRILNTNLDMSVLEQGDALPTSPSPLIQEQENRETRALLQAVSKEQNSLPASSIREVQSHTVCMSYGSNLDSDLFPNQLIEGRFIRRFDLITLSSYESISGVSGSHEVSFNLNTMEDGIFVVKHGRDICIIPVDSRYVFSSCSVTRHGLLTKGCFDPSREDESLQGYLSTTVGSRDICDGFEDRFGGG